MLEREILGCFIQDNSLIKETQIKPNYFENVSHQLIFTSMLGLVEEGKGVDRITLITTNYQYMEQLGANFFLELEASGNVSMFGSYEKQLIDNYKKRESKRLASEYLKSEKNPSQLIDRLRDLEEIGTEEETSVVEILESMHELPYSEEVVDLGIKTNLSDLDKVIGGFEGTNSYILGARPSMGKSATMLKFALEAMKQDVIPLIFSLEMSKESLLRRLIATIGEINLFNSRNPQQLSHGKKQDWQRAITQLKGMKFEIYDKSAQTIGYIRAQVRKAKRKYNKGVMVLIDYLTLINTTETFQSDHSRISKISKDLKNIARDYDCPVITLAQLSRNLEQRQDKRPLPSDLRESGSIEEDADVIMFLYRDDYYNKEASENILEINVAKNRNGPTGTAEIYYNKATGKMADLSVN